MKIAFTGYYGMGNYGDDLFVIAVAQGSEHVWNIIPEIIGKSIPNINANFTIKRFKSMYSKNNVVGKIYRMQKMHNAFKKNDIIILAGGSTISSETSNRMRSYQYKLLSNGVSKMAAIGVSVGPFKNKKDWVNAKRLIEKLEYISVRDKSSYSILQEMNIKTPYILGRDIAGVIPLQHEKPIRKKNVKKIVGVSLCNYESYTNGDTNQEEKRNIAIMKGVKKYIKDSKEEIIVRICVLNTDSNIGDREISQFFANELNELSIENEIVTHVKNPMEMYEHIATCDIFLSVRLHGAITAYLENVPFALIEYHNKCTSFLDDIGYNQNYRIKKDCSDSDHVKVVLQELDLQASKLYTYQSNQYISDSLETFKCAPWA